MPLFFPRSGSLFVLLLPTDPGGGGTGGLRRMRCIWLPADPGAGGTGGSRD